MSISGANKLTKRITSKLGAAPRTNPHKSNGSSSEEQKQKRGWFKCDIAKFLALGLAGGNYSTIIVFAEISRLHWGRWHTERSKPFPLPNEELAKLGVGRTCKKRALDLLKKVGFIKLQYRGRHLPLVLPIAEYPHNPWTP